MTRILSAALVLGIASAGAAFAQTAVNPTAATNASPATPAISTTTSTPRPRRLRCPAQQLSPRPRRATASKRTAMRMSSPYQGRPVDLARPGDEDGKSVEIALDYQGNIVSQ